MPKKALQELSYSVYNEKGEKVTEEYLIAPAMDIASFQKLVAQAVRVFLANQRQGTVSTKTRGEVEGSTRKIYRQKGTGRARHGDIKAPIFVGGGIIFGPKPRDFSLKINKKMKKKTLLVSLIDMILNHKLRVVEGWEKLPPKTKQFMQILQKIFMDGLKKEKILFVNSGSQNLKFGLRNLPFVQLVGVRNLNSYQLLTHSEVLVEKKVMADLCKRIGLEQKLKTKTAKKIRKRTISKKEDKKK